MSIPVIGVPVTNSTFWVNRLLTSIDYPVDEVLLLTIMVGENLMKILLS